MVKMFISHLCEQEGGGSEGEGPSIFVGEVGLAAFSPVQNFIVYTGDVENQTHHQSQTWLATDSKWVRVRIKVQGIIRQVACRQRADWCTWEDEEDPRDEGQDGSMRPNMADIVEYEADKHEEEADQRERSGRADHLWEDSDVECSLYTRKSNNKDSVLLWEPGSLRTLTVDSDVRWMLTGMT